MPRQACIDAPGAFLDVKEDRNLFIMAPKNGRPTEAVFVPKKVADRLKEYIRLTRTDPDERVFPLGYSGATKAVERAGMLVGIDLKPHDLRRHAAVCHSAALGEQI